MYDIGIAIHSWTVNMIWDTHGFVQMQCSAMLCYLVLEIFYPFWSPTMQKIKKRNEIKTEGYSTPVAAAGVCYNDNMRTGGLWRLVMVIWGCKTKCKSRV